MVDRDIIVKRISFIEENLQQMSALANLLVLKIGHTRGSNKWLINPHSRK